MSKIDGAIFIFVNRTISFWVEFFGRKNTNSGTLPKLVHFNEPTDCWCNRWIKIQHGVGGSELLQLLNSPGMFDLCEHFARGYHHNFYNAQAWARENRQSK